MWLAVISVLLSSSVCHGAYSHQYTAETSWDAHWTVSKANYWFSGQSSHHNDHREDRRFTWRHSRPSGDINTDYSYDTDTTTLSTTAYRASEWERKCSNNYAIYSIESQHDNDEEDRRWTIQCKKFPAQYTFTSCSWYPVSLYESTDVYANSWDNRVDFECSGVMRGMRTQWSGHHKDRRFKFYCCNIRHTPIDISSTYTDDRVLSQITSDYSDGTRTITESQFIKPNWYRDGADTVSSQYWLESTLAGVYYFARICPHNGAFTQLNYNEVTDRFSFQCAELINAVKMINCAWSQDYVNEFHSGFTADCPNTGAIRGIQGYYSPASVDRRFKLYCCVFRRGTYTANTEIRIKAKTDTISGSHSGSSNTRFDLCWNNLLYQGNMILNVNNRWFITQDVVQYDSCGNDRTITISMTSTNNLRIQSIGVEDNGAGVDYIINGFNVYNAARTESTYADVFVLDFNGVSITDRIVHFPDNFLTSCATTTDGGGCTGDLYTLEEEQYLITINLCPSFAMGSGTPEIGLILRGLNGNLDKTTLRGPLFEETPAGQGNIGELIHINMEYQAGPAICIESVLIHDPNGANQDIQFGQDQFADGIILSNNCDGGYFKRLSGTQYVPCYDTPYSITTYETSLSSYTSVEIHSCSGSGGGIGASNTELLSLTISGTSKNEEFVSSDALSLKTSITWNAGQSRDFTLQLPGGFDKVSWITLTNNHASDNLCVDSVLINGQDAFLTHYWVGTTDGSLQTIPAVLEWPICDIEIKTEIGDPTQESEVPESAATSSCVNKNRLLSVDCEISQTYETYEEVSWDHETGQEVTKDITMEGGTSTKVSISATVGVSSASEFTVGGVKETIGFSASVTAGAEREWSSSRSVSNGVTNLDVTTDGTVNGESISVECSGSVNVPPTQQVSYSLLIDHSAVTFETLTDIKMTKCSAFLNGGVYDENDYIEQYGIRGTLIVKAATNCKVLFSQAEALTVSATEITCGEERALATREWGTYVPQCNETDADKYMKCQCSYGDTKTLPTCGCVDEVTGYLFSDAKASLVSETDTYKWTDWCDDHCYSDGEVTEVVSKAVVPPSPHFEHDLVIDKVGEDYKKGSFLDYTLLVAVMFGIMYVITYMVNSCISCYKQCPHGSTANKYQSVGLFDTDTDIEKN